MTLKQNHKSKTGFLFLLTSLFSVGFLISHLPAGTENDGKSIENTRTMIEKWVENQRIISKEKRDLKLAKEMLHERTDLVQREIDSLRGKIGVAEESIAVADKNRAEMLQENEKLKAASTSLVNTLEALEGRTQQLIKRLPGPIRERIKPLSQRLPDGTQETRLSVSERFQNVVGILNEVDKFNRNITLNTEVRTMKDGRSVEVTALYIGIGQGYYASADGTIAGLGFSSDSGWEWQAADGVAAQINDVIAVLNNEKAASFIQVPVVVK